MILFISLSFVSNDVVIQWGAVTLQSEWHVSHYAKIVLPKSVNYLRSVVVDIDGTCSYWAETSLGTYSYTTTSFALNSYRIDIPNSPISNVNVRFVCICN